MMNELSPNASTAGLKDRPAAIITGLSRYEVEKSTSTTILVAQPNKSNTPLGKANDDDTTLIADKGNLSRIKAMFRNTYKLGGRIVIPFAL
jgi:hypothetical protein